MVAPITKDMEREVIRELSGEDTYALVETLRGRKNVSEFKLSEELNYEINATRNKLYRLYHANLVNFMKKKDKKKGWYIYYWTYYPEKIRYLYIKLKQQKYEKLKERLRREKNNNFFTCSNKCIRLDFERATEFEFKCPECGELLYQEENSQTINKIKDEITQLKSELKQILKS